MPAWYMDTSALVKRYVGEVGTLGVRRALARPVRQPIYTSLLAHTEVLSALQRKVREEGRSRRSTPSAWPSACSGIVRAATGWWRSCRRV
jgi:predicted nucleic acid-binding protein